MCASMEEVLKTEFGLMLGSPGVNILDPCTYQFVASPLQARFPGHFRYKYQRLNQL